MLIPLPARSTRLNYKESLNEVDGKTCIKANLTSAVYGLVLQNYSLASVDFVEGEKLEFEYPGENHSESH